MMKNRRLSIWICLLLLFTAPIQAQENGELQRLQRAETDTVQELLIVDGDIQSDRDRLQRVELTLRASTITPALLEDSRLDLVSFQSRKNGLQIRLKARRNALSQLGREIGEVETRILGEIGRADVRSQILFSIWDAFKEAGITIPYPQRDVHMHAVD